MEQVNLNEWSKKIHKANEKKGFWEKERSFGELVALMHSELSEALEADRKGRFANVEKDYFEKLMDKEPDEFKTIFEMEIKDMVEDELADAIIRILDYCGHKDIPIFEHIRAKLKYNHLRPYKHGKQY